MIEIDENDLKEINTTFKKLSNADKSKSLKEFADYVFEKALDRADKHTKTGAMIKAMFHKRAGNTYHIGVDTKLTPYALFVHWGSKEHRIYPKEKKALRWVSGNYFRFAKWIKHPGYKGDPFLDLALQDGIKKLPYFFNKLTKDI